MFINDFRLNIDPFGRFEKMVNKKELDLILPFQNREKEIRMIAEISLNNLKISQQPTIVMSTEKLTLLTAAQMWGSGKSWLGLHFPKVFGSEENRQLREELKKKYGEKNVNQLQNMIYLLVDFREWATYNNLDEYVKYSLLGSLLMLYPNDESYWERQSKSKTDCGQIVQFFSEKYKRLIFVHFDEVDLILNVKPEIDKNNQDMCTQRFYKFWDLIHRILMKGNLLYCSGRSPYLYYLGRGYYHTDKSSSPGNAYCILLDTLKEDNIEGILQVNPAIPDKSIRQQLAKMIYQVTSGVPRFVYYAIMWLKDNLDNNYKTIHLNEIPTDLFGDKFRNYTNTIKGAHSELNPIHTFNNEYKTIYLRMAAVSMLNIPVNPEANISLKNLGFLNLPDSIPFLEFVKIMNIYLGKNSSGDWTLIFPEIVLNQIASTIDSDELPSWVAASRKKYASAWNAGKLMESMVTDCLITILQRKFSFEKESKNLQDRFPFLHNSLFGEVPFFFPDEIQRSFFPKMVTKEEGEGGCKLIPKEEKEKKKERDQRLLELDHFFKRIKPQGYTPSNELRCNVADWHILIDRYVTPNTLYTSADMSSSADCMYFPSKFHILMFQVKARKDKLTLK